MASHLDVSSWIGDENGPISLSDFIEDMSHYIQLKNLRTYTSNITVNSRILGKGITYGDGETQWNYVGVSQGKIGNRLIISQPVIIDPTHEVGTVRFKVLRIDALYLEGVYCHEVARFSQLIFGPKNIPQVGQNIVSFGLNSPSVKVKDGQMSLLKGLLHSPKECKFDSCSLALPPHGDCNYCITY